MIVIVMGVSGAGKTLIGQMLAERLDCPFFDADAFHSEANKAKMHNGIALTDADRWPWLQAIHSAIEEKARGGQTAVFACSSLKKTYREMLGADEPAVRFVFLHGTFDLLHERLKARSGHFFDPSLLQSQLDTLEPPTAGEAIVVNIDATPARIVDEVLAGLAVGAKAKNSE